jgi:cytochrome P450 family 135
MSPATLPPGPRTPGLLNGLRYARDPLGYLPRLRDRYGDIFRLSFADFPHIVYVSDPELVKQVFTGDPRQLHAGEANATVLAPALGRSSVLVLDDDAHLRERKLLLPPFHGRALERYRAIMQRAAARDLVSWPVRRPFALRPHMQSVTLEVILRAVYGVRDDARFAEAERVVGRFGERLDVLMLPAALRRPRFPPWRRFVAARAALDALVHEEIALRRAAAGDGDEADDVLSLLLRARHDDGSAMTDDELRDELVTVVGAGHETTATALTWALERLLRHPTALERLRASLQDGETGYLDAVIKETLRVRPVIGDVARVLTAPLEIGGYTVPAGSMVLALITALHTRDDLYPDPHAFRPERFLGDGAASSTYTWIPFGGGVRRCLGAAFAQEEMRVVLREIVLRADLRAADPADERPRMRNVTIAPARGGRMVLQRPLQPRAEDAGSSSGSSAGRQPGPRSASAALVRHD